jgi:hypothetical protein
MRKLLAIIGALIAGGIGISLLPLAAHAAPVIPAMSSN